MALTPWAGTKGTAQGGEPHRSHLRTTNVIESPFAGVRLRTNAAKRFKKTKSGVSRRDECPDINSHRN